MTSELTGELSGSTEGEGPALQCHQAGPLTSGHWGAGTLLCLPMVLLAAGASMWKISV